MSERSPLIRSLPCVCCAIEGKNQPSETEEHHLNSFGMHGKKRRGDAFSIPLCRYHHHGHLPAGMTADEALFHYGPSWKLSPKKFREQYHGDDFLLSITNNCLEHGAYQIESARMFG